MDFAKHVLWEMITQGGADQDGDNRISEVEFARLLNRWEFILLFLLLLLFPNSRMLWVTISLCRGQGMLQLTGRGPKNF